MLYVLVSYICGLTLRKTCQESAILPARAANHSAGFRSSRLESHAIRDIRYPLQIKRRQCRMLAIKEDNCLSVLFLQELSNRLDDVTQEKSNLLSKVSGLEESISSADQERKALEDKMNAFLEGKDEVEKKVASVTERLETEKQVFKSLKNESEGEKMFKAREKSGNFLLSQGKFTF